MANDLNRCEFIGRLGADPEVRYLPSGTEVANFRIAVGEQWKREDGTKEERTEWVSCAAFGGLGRVIGEYCKKGSRVFVAGRLHTRKWQDSSGNDQYRTEIKVQDMQLLDSRASQEAAQPARGEVHQHAHKEKPPARFEDDDIPF